jgi:hypothetical protein
MDGFSHWYSDLSVLMASVKLNSKNKTSINIAMRVMSALPGKEKEKFPIYFQEIIRYSSYETNDGIFDNFSISSKK